MRLQCPGKVFIVGEYACIQGGPALVGTVEPFFSLDVERGRASQLPFHSESPAGLYLTAHQEALKNVALTWHDPYDTPIGVGSSSAQFLLSVAAVAMLESKPLPSAAEALEQYWTAVGSSQGLRPSGVDVLAQWSGGPLHARNAPITAEKLPEWDNKASAAFVLAFTGTKAKTHEHLQALLEKGFPSSYSTTLMRLDALTLKTIDAWRARDASLVGTLITAYQNELTQGGLAPREFTATLDEVRRWKGVLGCKGSGAQGGDCILLLVEKELLPQLKDRLRRERGWSPTVVRWSKTGLSVAQNGWPSST